ncbi:MAG: LysR family transcriptional regulator [Halioglobus sp.]|nr:LysR family transcriptional regulator [Halioglobus sp.]
MSATSHLRAFQALDLALRTGSLSAAANRLAITPAAVGQRIRTLEDYLGMELLVRGRSGLKPTTELTGAIEHIHQAFDALDRASEALDLQKVNEIHIAANSDLAEMWLWPRLESFCERHPNIQFCINGEGDVPMRIGPADCEIRFRTFEAEAQSDLLFRDYLAPVTSPINFERVRDHDMKLEYFPLLHLDFYKEDPEAISWPAWFRQYGHRTSAFERGMRYRQISPALKAILSDAGVMICGLAFLQDNLADGRIVAPFPLSAGSWTSFGYIARFASRA